LQGIRGKQGRKPREKNRVLSYSKSGGEKSRGGNKTTKRGENRSAGEKRETSGGVPVSQPRERGRKNQRMKKRNNTTTIKKAEGQGGGGKKTLLSKRQATLVRRKSWEYSRGTQKEEERLPWSRTLAATGGFWGPNKGGKQIENQP